MADLKEASGAERTDAWIDFRESFGKRLIVEFCAVAGGENGFVRNGDLGLAH
jgi:hypothetical protein